MDPIEPTPDDLCLVDDVANWLNMPSALSSASSPDAAVRNIIQEAISGWSDYVLWRTGRDSGYFVGDGGSPPDYTVFQETRDGNDADSMGVLSGPINLTGATIVPPINGAPNSVLFLQINNQIIPQSTSWNQFGWFVEQNPSFIGLRRGSGFLQGAGNPFGSVRSFVRGKGNVTIFYKGGYKETPPSLFEKTMIAVGVVISRRLRQDEGARTTPASGAISNYRSYAWPPECTAVLKNFERTIMTFGGGI